MLHILYVEDEMELGTWVYEDFKRRGYEVTWLTSGDQAMSHMDKVDIVILDIMLPGLDGFSIGRRIKKEYPSIPIMMLSARSAVEDKVEGLQFADDFLTKPFHPDELDARIQVLLRRFDRVEPEEVSVQHLIFYPKMYQLVEKETKKEISLTSKQIHIFQYLVRHAGQIVTKEQIYESVWGEAYFEGDKTLMVHIRYLREKIEKDAANPSIIETIRGIGYRLKR